jgi:hypothetical protein
MILIVIGALILLGVFGGIFAEVASLFGWRVSAAIWASSIAVTAVIVGAALLISAGLSS